MKVGIIGSEGNIGKRRADIIAKKFKDIKLSLFDISNTQWHTSYKAFIMSTDFDAVFICVPHSLTTEMTEYALNRGIHVFAEKPPGICLDDVKQMQEALKKHPQLKLKFGFNHRYYKHIQLAKKTIDSGELGEVLWIRGLYGKVDLENWRTNQELAGHGILLSQGIHMVDLCRFLSNQEFSTVKSIISKFGMKWYEDNVMALLKSEFGTSAFVHSSCLMGQNTFNMMIGMEKGYIKINGLFTRTKSFGFPEEVRIARNDESKFYGNPIETVTRFGTDPSWYLEIEEFIDAVENDKPIIHGTIDDAYQVMKIVDKIYEDGK